MTESECIHIAIVLKNDSIICISSLFLSSRAKRSDPDLIGLLFLDSHGNKRSLRKEGSGLYYHVAIILIKTEMRVGFTALHLTVLTSYFFTVFASKA